MDFEKIHDMESLGEVELPATYSEGLNSNSQGTTVVLSCLRCDSIKARHKGLFDTLQRNFAYFGDDFKVFLNDEGIQTPKIDYEFIYTGDNLPDEDGYAEFNVDVFEEDGESFDYPIEVWVGFRKRLTDDGVGKGSLPAKERGARVYCNGCLAAEPTLFDLPTGMHNFHAQSYMECFVRADVLGNQEVDLISTNRQGFKTDNIIVDSFIETVSERRKNQKGVCFCSGRDPKSNF